MEREERRREGGKEGRERERGSGEREEVGIPKTAASWIRLFPSPCRNKATCLCAGFLHPHIASYLQDSSLSLSPFAQRERERTKGKKICWYSEQKEIEVRGLRKLIEKEGEKKR